jgi:RsiW-degrading membrane proteinase PrsW (M82 family)/ribosomal protein L40E
MDKWNIVLSIIVTAGLWLKFLYKYDKIEPEPIWKVLKIGLLGGLCSALIAGIINTISGKIFGFKTGHANSFFSTLFFSLAVGLNEETMKAFFTKFFTKNETELDEPIDAVIYSTSVALGFAVLENLEYTFSNGLFNLGLRTFTAMPLHIGLAVIWGISIARVRFFPKANYFSEMAHTVLWASLIHGVYDFIIFYFQNFWVVLFSSLVIAFLLIRYLDKNLKFLQNQTPYLPAGTCSNCGHKNSPTDTECKNCHSNLEQKYFSICNTCAIKLPSESTECSSCGRPVNPKYLYQDKNHV